MESREVKKYLEGKRYLLCRWKIVEEPHAHEVGNLEREWGILKKFLWKVA